MGRSSDVPAGRNDGQAPTIALNAVGENSLGAFPNKRKHSELSAVDSGNSKALLEKWTQKLNEIQSRDPTAGSGSFRAEELRELPQVLRLTHPNFTRDEDDERKELLSMIESKHAAANYGALGWADLSSLRLICLVHVMPVRSLREEFENEACVVDLEASSRQRAFLPTAVRRLKRVFERLDPHHQHNELYHEVTFALKNVTRKSVLERDIVRRCLKHLFPAVDDATRDKESNSVKTSSELDAEIRATPQRQAAASRNEPGAAAVLTRSQAFPPTENRQSTPTTSLTTRPTRTPQVRIEDSDRLIKTFIAMHCSILPIFDVPHLKLFYRAVRTKENDAPVSNLAIINLCFALASMANDQRSTQQAIGCYNRGTSLLSSLKESGETLMLIQAHVLQAQYLFEQGDLDEASVVVSSAISRAHSEGIHTKAGAYHPISQRDMQLRAKLWHAIQVIERTLALYRGAAPPNFCSDCNAAFPRNPTISEEDSQVLRIGFVAFNAWARLYQPVDTLMDIEREFRIYEGGCQMHKIACNFKDYNEEHARLTEWKQSLSRDLNDVPDDKHCVARLRTIIHLRYLYYRLRLHRPFLILALSLSLKCTECPGNPPHLLDHSLEAPIEFAAIRDGFIKCLKAAVELEDKLYQHTGHNSASLYFKDASITEHAEFAYACGLVFLAARMVPDLAVGRDSGILSVRTIRWSEVRIFSMLGKYGRADQYNKALSALITRCADALGAFNEAVGVERPVCFISEDVGLPTKSWQKLYGRLKVDFPVRQSIPSTADSSMSFAWIESQLVDFAD